MQQNQQKISETAHKKKTFQEEGAKIAFIVSHLVMPLRSPTPTTLEETHNVEHRRPEGGGATWGSYPPGI